MSEAPAFVAVHADESCIGNGRKGDNPGGAGGLVEWMSPRTNTLLRWDYWISEPATTNNRMALRSLIEAFRGMSAKGGALNVRFTSDSRYIVDGMTVWVPDWIKRDWRRKTGPIVNLELWHEAVEAVDAHVVQWEWVRGHAGHPENEYANHLATTAAATQTSSNGFQPSGYEQWLAENRARLPEIFGEEAQLPTADTFKPGRRSRYLQRESTEMDDLDRLFQRLVHNLRDRSPAQAKLPFTVAELYEQLVPYRHNRRELGIETNQDYETALTRLLAGERGYVLSDAAMQEALKRDLSSRDSDPGAFREFATTEVSISPNALASAPTDRRPTPARDKTPAAQVATPSGRGKSSSSPAATPSGIESPGGDGARAETKAPNPLTVSVADGCRFCGAALPAGRDAKFCPTCGQNLTVIRCPACANEVEAGWKFCIACGRPAVS